MLAIEENMARKEVRVGQFVTTRPCFHCPPWEGHVGFKQQVLHDNDVSYRHILGASKRESRSFYARHLGCRFNRRFLAAQFRCWVEPYPILIKAHCRTVEHGGRLSNILVERFYRYLPLILQARDDGLDHLISPILYFGCAPREIKRILGKGLWKALCRNSRSRNRLLFAHACGPWPWRVLPPYGRVRLKDASVRLHAFNQLPTSLLKGSDQMDMFRHSGIKGVQAWVSQQAIAQRCVSDEAAVMRLFHLYEDTYLMAREQQACFNPRWSCRRMQEEHNHLVQMQSLAEYSDEPFADIGHFVQDSVIDGVAVQLLRSPKAIAGEGLAMNHCVAAYSSTVHDGHSVLYSLTELDTHQRSTLEIRLSPSGISSSVSSCVSLGQHTGPCNASIESAQLTHVARKVMQRVAKRRQNTVAPLVLEHSA